MEWLASPSASAAAATSSTRAAAAAAGFLELALPYHLSLLPSLFRMVALVFFAPVFILAAGDCLGWAFFKLILRPLGYSSVIRFKDPEPPTTRLSPPSAPSSKRARSSQRASKHHDEQGVSRTSSLPAPPRPRRHSTSSTIHATSALGLGGLDSGASSTTHSPPNGEARSASPSSFTTTSSSSPSSPILMTYSSSSSLASSPSNSPKSIDLALPSQHPHGRPRSASTGSTSSSILPGLRRHRAASVGVEGPLFGTQEDGEEPGLMSPARSDCEELPPMTESESEGEGAATTTVRRRRGRQAGVPRRGPKFDFTVME